MKKTSEEKKRLRAKAKKKAANIVRNLPSSAQRRRLEKQALSPEERKKMMIQELQEIEAYEKHVQEEIVSKIQESSIENLQDQKNFLEQAIKELEDKPKALHLRQRYANMIEQIDSSSNFDFLRKFYTELQEDETYKEVYDPITKKFTPEFQEEIFTSYRTSLENDPKTFIEPEIVFTNLQESVPELENFTELKTLYCLYMETRSLMEVGYLITIISKRIIIREPEILADFAKLATEIFV
jgi:hypothetical protein